VKKKRCALQRLRLVFSELGNVAILPGPANRVISYDGDGERDNASALRSEVVERFLRGKMRPKTLRLNRP
jgi:hypothetical protein